MTSAFSALPRPVSAIGVARGPARAQRRARAVLIGALALAIPGTAMAATSTASLGVSATVVATCVISSSPMAFGNYSGVVVASTATLTVTCTNTTPYTVGLGPGAGTGPVATVTTRHMMNATAVLNYVLTQDAAHVTNWGNTPTTDTPASAVSAGGPFALTVYGQVAAGQFVAPGSYADTVTATVTF